MCRNSQNTLKIGKKRFLTGGLTLSLDALALLALDALALPLPAHLALLFPSS